MPLALFSTHRMCLNRYCIYMLPPMILQFECIQKTGLSIKLHGCKAMKKINLSMDRQLYFVVRAWTTSYCHFISSDMQDFFSLLRYLLMGQERIEYSYDCFSSPSQVIKVQLVLSKQKSEKKSKAKRLPVGLAIFVDARGRYRDWLERNPEFWRSEIEIKDTVVQKRINLIQLTYRFASGPQYCKLFEVVMICIEIYEHWYCRAHGQPAFPKTVSLSLQNLGVLRIMCSLIFPQGISFLS